MRLFFNLSRKKQNYSKIKLGSKAQTKTKTNPFVELNKSERKI
jgi:hypothetical protein